MRRAARLGLVWALALGGPPAARAQAVPPAPAVSPRPDSAKAPPPTFVADTTRAAPGVGAEPGTAVTRPLALRIGAVIVVLTLTTLLLYNVRSR